HKLHHLLAGRGRNVDASESTTDCIKQVVNTAAKRGRADGNGEGDEDDEHGVFGGRGPALVPTKAIEETKHERFLLQVRSGPMASARQRRSQCTQPIPTLTVFHQWAVQSGVRKPSLHIILLDFGAIAGEFLVCRGTASLIGSVRLNGTGGMM